MLIIKLEKAAEFVFKPDARNFFLLFDNMPVSELPYLIPSSVTHQHPQEAEAALGFMQTFLQRHQYNPQSIKIRKVSSILFKEHVDPITYELVQPFQKDESKLKVLLRMCDFLQFQILKRALVTILACRIYLERDDQKSREEYKAKHQLEELSDEQKYRLCQEYSQVFKALTQKVIS